MDCIHKSGDICKAYRDKKCEDCKCALTAEQADAKRRKHDARLRRLPAEQQKAIADKYYEGVVEWSRGW